MHYYSIKTSTISTLVVEGLCGVRHVTVFDAEEISSIKSFSYKILPVYMSESSVLLTVLIEGVFSVTDVKVIFSD